MYLSTGIERLKPARFIFLIKRTDGESGNYINCFWESVNFFIPKDKISSGDLLNDFTSLSDDLEKSRARSPDQDSCISEAQFIFFRPQIEADVNFKNAFETKNETNGTVSKNLELILIPYQTHGVQIVLTWI